MGYIGRKTEAEGKVYTQSVSEHIQGVVSYVDSFALSPGLKATAKLIGYLHDQGKYRVDWQDYITAELQVRGSVPHSLTGMRGILELLEKVPTTQENAGQKALLCEVVQYVVGAHHGLFDALDYEDGHHRLDDKEQKAVNDPTDTQAIESFYTEFSEEEVAQLVEESLLEIQNVMDIFFLKAEKHDQEQFCYYLGVTIRLLLSAQIDADWSDATDFSYRVEEKSRFRTDFSGWDPMITTFEEKISAFTPSRPIDFVRNQISDEARAAAKRPPGIYKMDVPTGGGKTLASMRFALHHAKKHDMKRIFYIAPYTSILEQNADEYRKFLVNDQSDESLILEHHSNVVFEEDSASQELEARYDKKEIYKSLSSNWDAPVVVTTMVQLLNTLFSADKKSIRRMHRLDQSVIIIDELQSLPVKSTTLFNLAANAIQKLCNTTFVMCTATQPPYERVHGKEDAKAKIAKINYANDPDLISSTDTHPAFIRTTIVDKTRKRPYSLEEVAELVEGRMEKESSLLVILNTRGVVNKLTQLLKETKPDYQVISLSNDMVPAHRDKVLKSIRGKLGSEKIVVVTTPLIEAGVDISFSGVIRSVTGLDKAFQAAGRCNRHQEQEIGEVWIINLDPEEESVSRMEDVSDGQIALQSVLNDFRVRPEHYEHNLLSKAALDLYYSNFLERVSVRTHYELKKPRTTIYDLLHSNQKGQEARARISAIQTRKDRMVNQAFKTAGDAFQAIDQGGFGVLVPWGEGVEIINELLGENLTLKQIHRLMAKAQKYSVNMLKYRLDQLIQEGAVYSILENHVYVLREGYYDDETGLVYEKGEMPTSLL